VLAQEEARLLNHGFIGTEHILLALIHEGEGLAAEALAALGISLEAVREKVEETIGVSGSAPMDPVPFTPRAKKVLELSLREALQMGHQYIGTEHILLGLVREGEGVAATVLVSLGGIDRPRHRSRGTHGVAPASPTGLEFGGLTSTQMLMTPARYRSMSCTAGTAGPRCTCSRRRARVRHRSRGWAARRQEAS